MAIEGLDEKIFSEKTDVWAFGVLMWEIVSYGETPYRYIKTPDVQKYVREGNRLECPKDTPPSFWKVIAGCWAKKPDQRLCFADLQNVLHQTLKQFRCDHRDIGMTLQAAGGAAKEGADSKRPSKLHKTEIAGTASPKTPKKSQQAGSPSTPDKKAVSVTEVLAGAGLSQYAASFEKNKISLFMFQRLNAATLGQLGIYNKAHSQKIMTCIADLKGASAGKKPLLGKLSAAQEAKQAEIDKKLAQAKMLRQTSQNNLKLARALQSPGTQS